MRHKEIKTEKAPKTLSMAISVTLNSWKSPILGEFYHKICF